MARAIFEHSDILNGFPVIRTLIKRIVGRASPAFFERLLAFPIFEREFAEIRSKSTFLAREALWADLRSRVTKPLCYLEFGVWKGSSISWFANHDQATESRLFGFDSFEGLPEDWAAFQPKGHFSTGGVIPRIDDPRVRFVKGWFNETLEPFLRRERELCDSVNRGDRTLVVHFDADLFSSTMYVLSVLSFHFDSYYFIFDEFIGDEARALYEVRRAFGVETEFFGLTDAGGYPMQVSGLLRRRGAPRED